MRQASINSRLKKYVRRIRDKVPYSDWDKEQLQDANSSWMAEDSFPRALCEYNEMVDEIFQSIVIAERVCDERICHEVVTI
ncbi:hypothetical protein DMI70_01020 [Escherichia coli]|nr:hypothetical protein [Escherichia coli]